MKNQLIQMIGKNVIAFSAIGVALLLGSCSSDSNSNISSDNNAPSGDNNATVSDWTYIINHPQEGFVMKALFNDGVTEVYTCRPGGLCDISFSDGSEITSGVTYQLTKLDDNRAMFHDVQSFGNSAQTEDTFNITHDAATGKCTAIWSEKAIFEDGTIDTDREDNIVITFERL